MSAPPRPTPRATLPARGPSARSAPSSAYAIKTGPGQLQPLTRYVDPATLVDGASNTIVFERDELAKDLVFRLFSTNHSPESSANCLSELMCCLPRLSAPQQLGYEQVFRVLIVQFMDARNLDIRALKKSCVHIATPDGRMVPFEAYGLFYRDGRQALLQTIQGELAQQHAWRRQG